MRKRPAAAARVRVRGRARARSRSRACVRTRCARLVLRGADAGLSAVALLQRFIGSIRVNNSFVSRECETNQDIKNDDSD